MAARTYSVPSIHCGHCKAAIESEVGKLAGLQRVEVDVDAKTVLVEGEVDEQAVREAIDEAGYEVAAVS